MTISYRWLSNYLPEHIPVEELSNILTSIGLEVESVEKAEAIKGSLEGLITGEVLTCEKHPNADKLKVTTVNIGQEEPLHIVCGAPNVAAGQKVIVAPVGTTIYPINGEPFTIKKAKIRGEASQGMICAEDEIGLGNDHDGIIILPHHTHVGAAAKSLYNIPEADYAIEIGLTPNRSDAMSHIGVAKDVCAYLSYHKGKNYEVLFPPINTPDAGKDRININVNIKSPEACPRYMGVSIKDVKVAPSPEWLQRKLTAIGARPINNIVDITNFVLHEWGQPLHAFDADKIKGNTVNVQFLPQDSRFITLDEKEVKLQDDDLMICDDADGMCIAGVFGGAHSGVSDATQNIFLESAYFHPKFIRRTSLHHGFRTDAATHFEKGVDINNLEPALKRAADLIVELAGGTIASDIIDIYPNEVLPAEVNISYTYINKLTGKEYAPVDVKKILVALGFEIATEDKEGLILNVPTNKTDVLQPADIVEEIIRIDGLDNIEIPQRLNISLNKPMPNDRALQNKVAGTLYGMGFHEIVTNSIVNSKHYEGRNDLVKMLNSLSSELDVLRPSMLESGLDVIQYNYNRKKTDLLLYDFGKIYTTVDNKYVEQPQLAIYVTGNVQQGSWNVKAQTADIYYLKGAIENILTSVAGVKYKLKYEHNMITWVWKNQDLCKIEEVDAKKLSAFDIKQPVFYAIINWSLLVEAANAKTIKYKEVVKYPTVNRDLAVVVDKAVSYEQIKEATDGLKIDSLQSFGLFDVFESEKIGADKKSLALNYTFQLQDRTLTDAEIEASMNSIIKSYKTKLQAQIRE